MNVAEAMKYEVFLFGAPEDKIPELETIQTLQNEVLRLQKKQRLLLYQLRTERAKHDRT